ncbi:flagellar hook assembly protein FlgD [Buchnera aphidicola]|uniref:flagellar hook assembly protein FlgD n=1 Tax=Buchnera aphidicola TaxID=9 RepID=UPI0031B815A5
MNILDNNLINNNTYISNNNEIYLKKNNELNSKNNFLKLLIAQIKNQDPIDPIKNTDITSLLTQIENTNDIKKVNDTLLHISENSNNLTLAQTSEIIGHGVLFPSYQIEHDNSKDNIFGVYLSEDTTFADATISDKDGKIIFFKDLSNFKAGVHQFKWDDSYDKDIKILDGMYNINVNARNDKKLIFCQPLVYGMVDGIINVDNNKKMADLGKFGLIELNSIKKIF